MQIFYLDITLRLKQLWCFIEKCRTNSSRHPTVYYKCSYVKLLFYSAITVHKKIKNHIQ